MGSGKGCVNVAQDVNLHGSSAKKGEKELTESMKPRQTQTRAEDF